MKRIFTSKDYDHCCPETSFFFYCLYRAHAGINEHKQSTKLVQIPPGEITPKGNVFYQYQLNVHWKYFESKGHFVYGLGKGRNAGVNLVSKGFFFTVNRVKCTTTNKTALIFIRS